MNNKQQNITTKLQNLVKRKKTPIVVTKAGSVKKASRSSGSSFEGDYYPSSYAE